jgi:hypothetical protein
VMIMDVINGYSNISAGGYVATRVYNMTFSSEEQASGLGYVARCWKRIPQGCF